MEANRRAGNVYRTSMTGQQVRYLLTGPAALLYEPVNLRSSLEDS